jgi:hypothetical protein
MTCRAIRPWVVDLARGVTMDAIAETEVHRHRCRCARCAAVFDEERAISAALRRFVLDDSAPLDNSRTEQVLLEAFDRAWAGRRRRSWPHPSLSGSWPAYAAAAALLILLATIGPPYGALREILFSWSAQRVAGLEVDDAASSAEMAVSDFVPWPGAAELPPLESGHLVRMDLPTSVLPSLGFIPPDSLVEIVQADVLVGQDGFARAVRLILEP